MRSYRPTNLYVIGVPGATVVKIGIADCPTRRAAGLGSGGTLMPEGVVDCSALRVLHQEPGHRGLERVLHGRLSHRRVIGEWFDLGPVAVPLIKSLIREVRGGSDPHAA